MPSIDVYEHKILESLGESFQICSNFFVQIFVFWINLEDFCQADFK